MMISLCDAALRADASLNHELLPVVVGQLVDKAATAEHFKEVALPSRSELKTALLATHAMFDGEIWKRLLLDKHFDED